MATAKEIRRELVQSSLHDLVAARRHVAFTRKHAGRAAKALAKLRKADLQVWAYPIGTEYFSFSITLRDLDGFTGGSLINTLALIEKATGVEFTGSRDFPDMSLREFTGKSEDGLIKVEVNAYLATEAKHCKRVQIGVEKIEVPKYQLVCE